MTNPRNKGKRGERELAKYLTAAGYPARRGQQYNGLDGEDVVCDSLAAFHIECKRVERLDLMAAVRQSQEDAGDRIPVVMHRRNRSPWLVTMLLDDWLGLQR